LFAIGGHVVGMDLFDCRHTLTKLLPKLVRSYALDALESQAIPSKAFNLSDVQKFITALSSAKAEVFPSVGEGEEVRLAAHGLTAAALVARDRVVHLSAFNLVAVADSTSGGSGSNVSPPSVRRRLRHIIE
jgi:antitoxin (DNA-binding transcriptional repressor) of toxin-antitoxin stability system